MPTMELITRAEALAQGLNRYFTGKPCKRGHVSQRTIGASNCIACHKERYATEEELAKFAAYRAKNPGQNAARVNFDKARKLGLLCSCCKVEDFFPIYAQANALGHEVDHRIPKERGGPHCLKNLQILTKATHKEKTKREQQCRAA